MNTGVVSPLRVMFWKETRELTKWAFFGAIALSIALVYVIGTKSTSDTYIGWPNVSYSDFWSTVSLVMTIGAPLIAFAIAMAQILPELRRDQWAFLIHRPANRSVLFWGKAAAGLSLALLASSLPFLMAVLWARTPGNLAAPFDWRLTLGGITTLLNSSVFYFAGLLIALRPARWYGSRAFPVVTAIATTLICVGPRGEFWQALVAIAISVIVLGTAAHGSFCTTGQYASQSKPSKAALGLTLAIGLTGTLVTMTALVVNICDQFFVKHSAELPYSSYRITNLGKIVRITFTTPDTKVVTDLAGNKVDVPVDESGNQYLYQCDFFDPQSHGPLVYTNVKRYILLEASTRDSLWFYAFGQGRLLEYSRNTHQLLGYLTPQGYTSAFAKANKSTDRFPGDMIFNYYDIYGQYEQRNFYPIQYVLPFQHAVFHIDFDNRRVQPLDTQALHSKTGFSTSVYPRNTSLMIVMSHLNFEIIEPDGTPKMIIPITENRDLYKSITLAMTAQMDRYFVWYTREGDSIYNSRMPSLIDEYSKQGTLVNRTILPALSSSSSHQENLGYWFGVLAPPIFTPYAAAMAYAFTRDQAIYIRFGVVSIAASLFYALLAWLIGRRCALTRSGQFAWTIGVFGLGLLGVLLMLSLFDWPAREICPQCGKKRVVEHVNCEHCGAEFGAPTRDGTEIFEDVSVSHAAMDLSMEEVR